MAKIPGKTEKLILCTYKFMVLVCIWPSKHVTCDTQVSGFLLVLWFLPPIKMTATIQLKYYWKWFSPGTLVSSTNKNDSHDTKPSLWRYEGWGWVTLFVSFIVASYSSWRMTEWQLFYFKHHYTNTANYMLGMKLIKWTVDLCQDCNIFFINCQVL